MDTSFTNNCSIGSFYHKSFCVSEKVASLYDAREQEVLMFSSSHDPSC